MNADPKSFAGNAAETPIRITQEHLARLVCPVCHSGLVLEGASEAVPQTIRCSGCGRRYPVVDDLPVLLAGRSLL